MVHLTWIDTATQDSTAYRDTPSVEGTLLPIRLPGQITMGPVTDSRFVRTSDFTSSVQREYRWGVEQSERGLETQFRLLAKQWKDETSGMSSITHIARNSAYQRIIGMGPRGISLILKELEREPDEWFWALNALTGENPIPAESEGVLSGMVDAWLQWGREHHYID